ncbi:serine hydrolase domain-containing protein [Pedomonas mirosovicensis]|uniref:serine hydrolase domain-containing protein n=1 Tax=Pedomonas mirosovicensis TaxID=2908641 RepID=UPI002169E787|nr:serine hydrolase domain-containing protein [Pedomonas mirosovicensis]MCH8686299.1 beta-lactamase family protein [Pedomonas mirosovicensis]
MSQRATRMGFCTQRLARLDRFLQTRYIDTGRLPCAETLIYRHGEVVHRSRLGLADVERGKPLAGDTLYRIYSMTKPIASVAFLMLVEEGLVALDDPVHRFIPEWEGLGVYEDGAQGAFRTRAPERPMQMVDLLRHTSGLTYGFQQRTPVDAAYRALGVGEIALTMPLEEMIGALTRLPLEFSPGTAWNYSVSTDVLGYLVGRIAGKPFEDVVQERILDPLGMKDTGFAVKPGQAERLAACYQVAPEGGFSLYDDPASSPYLSPPVMASGGGGLVSTTEDYLRFCRMLLQGGQYEGARLLAPKTIELMTANHLPEGKDIQSLSQSMFSESAYAGVGFGLGFAVTMDPARTLLPGSAGDYFWGGMASTYFWVDPKEDMAVLFMTQLIPSSTYPVRRELRTLVYSALVEPN